MTTLVTTLADAATPLAWQRDAAARAAYNAVLIVAGSLLVALSAQIAVPLAPVPITMQPFAVLLVGASLGARRGALALALYLAQGAAGLPVFAAGGCCIARLAGPTAGYLWSYPLAAGLVGWLAERGMDRRPLTAMAAMLAGTAVIYLIALPWLSLYVAPGRVLADGLVPFIAGDLAKVALAGGALPGAWAVLRAVRRALGLPER
ncbi:hypothetical protein BH23GEM10_BH23GEM10_10670 [soil metagenome]